MTLASRWLVVASLSALAGIAVGVMVTAGRRVTPLRPGSRRAVATSAVLALGPLLGVVLTGVRGHVAVVVVAGAVGLAGVGIVAHFRPALRGIVPVGVVLAAVAVVVADVRIHPTGVGVLDVVATVLAIAAVTLTTDGLGHGSLPVAGVAALGIFALTAFAHEHALAGLTLGLLAAVGGLLVSGAVDPTEREPGTLLVPGFVVAATAFAAQPSRSDEWVVLATPLILLTLLLLDAAVVVTSRLRRRTPILTPRDDHLSHRLIARGWRPSLVVLLLTVVQLALTVDAVFTGRGLISVAAGVSVAVIIGVLVVAVAAARSSSADRVAGLPRPLKALLVGSMAIAVLVIVPVAVVAPGVRGLVNDARRAAIDGLSAARAGHAKEARAAFGVAATDFARAHDKLTSPLNVGSLAWPWVAPNVRAARDLTRIGATLSAAGRGVTAAVNPDRLGLTDGRLPLEDVERVLPALARGADALDSALRDVRLIRHERFLVPPLKDAIRDLERELAPAAADARQATRVAQFASAIFGGGGPRNYLLVAQNNAEARGTGGFIGSYALMTAVEGKLTVGPMLRAGDWNDALPVDPEFRVEAPKEYHARYDRFLPQRRLQSVNFSPDFPTVAGVLMELAPSVGLPRLDGVVAVDPVGLAGILELTGPVEVADWPEPITAENVVAVTLREAYGVFSATDDRADFLGDVAAQAMESITANGLGTLTDAARVLGRLSRQGHLLLTLARPVEERLANLLVIDGAVRPARSDALGVTTSNVSGNKLDYYSERTVSYQLHLDPSAHEASARVSGKITVGLANTAPVDGLPHIVGGPYDDRFVAGENRTYVSLYSKLAPTSVRVDGQPAAVETGTELGRHVVATTLSVFAGTSRTVEADVVGTVPTRGGWYSLDLAHQPTLVPDKVRVSVSVPEGWRVEAVRGMHRRSPSSAEARFTLQQSTRLKLRIVPDVAESDIWARLRSGG